MHCLLALGPPSCLNGHRILGYGWRQLVPFVSVLLQERGGHAARDDRCPALSQLSEPPWMVGGMDLEGGANPGIHLGFPLLLLCFCPGLLSRPARLGLPESLVSLLDYSMNDLYYVLEASHQLQDCASPIDARDPLTTP